MVDYVAPKGTKAARVLVLTPESPDAVEVKPISAKGRVRFTLPKFLVYAVARVELAKE